MIEVLTTIEIAAPADVVWRVLLDLRRYPRWNPFLRHVQGSTEVGRTVRLHAHTRFGIPLRFRATILEHAERRCLRWRGKLGAPWLATGEHRFELEPLAPARVRLIHAEKFSGLVPRLVGRLLAGEVRHEFDAMNRALAAQAEAEAATSARAHELN